MERGCGEEGGLMGCVVKGVRGVGRVGGKGRVRAWNLQAW